MKRLTIFTTIVILFLSNAFSTEITTGLTYDSHNAAFPVGADFSLTETFEDGSDLSAGLTYKNAGAYTASLLYNKIINVFMLSGGLNYDLSKDCILPGVHAGAGLVFNRFSFIAAGGANLNPENIFFPNAYNCTADVIFDTTESIIDLSFLFSSQETTSGKNTKLGGGIKFTAYQDGAPATIDILVNAAKVVDPVSDINGVTADAGMGINVMLPFMSIHLKTLMDVVIPGVKFGTKLPFSVSLSTGFKL